MRWLVLAMLAGYYTRLLSTDMCIHHPRQYQSRCVCAGVACKVQVHSLQVPRVSIPLERRQLVPLLFYVERTVSANRSVDISRASAIDARKVSPFYSQ